MGRTKCAATNSESLTLTPKSGKNKCANSRIGQQMALAQKTGFEGRLDAPWRKTVKPFNIAFTLVHTTSKGTKKQPQPQKSNQQNEKEKGRQIFWARSLEGLHAMVPVKVADKFSPDRNVNIPQRLELPSKLEIMAPTITQESASATFCTALHTFEINGADICGQQATRKQIEENPFETLKFDQPFIQIPSITEQDITLQERRVLDARKRLQELRKSFMIR